jgi:hypothetical protein
MAPSGPGWRMPGVIVHRLKKNFRVPIKEGLKKTPRPQLEELRSAGRLCEAGLST